MAERIWRCQNDHGTTRSAHPPLRYRRNRQRKLALQEPRLTAASRSLATALWGRARSRLAPPYTNQEGVPFERRYGVPIRSRLTHCTQNGTDRIKIGSDRPVIFEFFGLPFALQYEFSTCLLSIEGLKERPFVEPAPIAGRPVKLEQGLCLRFNFRVANVGHPSRTVITC